MVKNIPIPEMHLLLPTGVESENVPGGSFNNTGKYLFCGPGTKVAKRLNDGYKGVNILDRQFKIHDIAYLKNKSTKDRNITNDILTNNASTIPIDSEQLKYFKNDAKLVNGIMGLKSRFGMGIKKISKF